MLSKTCSFIFFQGVPAPCPWMLCTQRCCRSPWHVKPCTRLLTTKAPDSRLALPHPHSSGSVTQWGAANKTPHHGCRFHQVPLALPCTSGWSCPPTRNWGTNTSPRITDSRCCVPQSTAFPLTDPEGLGGCQRDSEPTYRMWKNKTM